MGWVKYLAIALAAIATSFSAATITATNAEARCKGCSAPVVSRSTRHVRGGTTVRRSKAVRRTSSTRTKRVRRVTTTVRTRYVQPVRHVRTIHTVHHRRVVYHQRRTVNRTVVRPTRVVHSHSVRHVNLGTVHVNMNCNRCN